MASRLVVHIGDPKTGSSSIQRTLFERRFDCATVTVDYPPTLTALPLAVTLHGPQGPKRAAKVWKDTADWAGRSTAEVAVLSAEQFASVPPAAMNGALCAHLPDLAASAQIVAYARPHASRLVSSYSQRAKAGKTQKTLDQFGAMPDQLTILQMHRRFSAWRDQYGDRFILRPMVRAALRDGDVVADFLGIVVDGAPFALTGATEANVSLCAEALAAIRAFHAALQSHGVSDNDRHVLGARVSDLAARGDMPRGTRLQVHKALYQRIVDTQLQDARRLDRNFLGAGIMEQALMEGEAEAVANEIPLEIEAHFAPAVIAALDQTVTQIAALIKLHPDVWRSAFRRAKGKMPPLTPAEALSLADLAAISQTEALVAQATALMHSFGPN